MPRPIDKPCLRPLMPEEVAMAADVLKEYCVARRCDRKSDEAEAVARDIIRWLQTRVPSRERLQEILRARSRGQPFSATAD